MPILLADTNALRNPNLKRFFEVSRDHQVAISDLMIAEMRKKNALLTSRASLEIVAQFTKQVFVLKRTHEVLDFMVTGPSDIDSLIDYQATVDLFKLSEVLRAVPVPRALPRHMANLEIEARFAIDSLQEQMSDLEQAMVDVTKDLTADQLKQLRTGRGVTQETQSKVFELLKDSVGNSFVSNGITRGKRGITIGDARTMFVLRYCLCMIIYYILWIQKGRQTGVAAHLRTNDVVDMQLVAMSTFFNGVLSGDRLVRETSRAARAMLRNIKAYVGDDWIVPAALDEMQLQS